MVLTNLLAGHQWRCRHREPTCGHSGGGEGGIDWKSNTETYTICQTDSQWEFAV